MSGIDENVYYIVDEDNWLIHINDITAQIDTNSSFVDTDNDESLEFISEYVSKTCVYEVNSYKNISNYNNLIIPYLSTKDNENDILISLYCTIKHPDFITTKITSNSLTIENDCISGNITKTSECNFNKAFGIKDSTTYTPFNSDYELSYDTLTVDKNFEFCNLGKLTVGELTIEKNKKLTVSSGTITVTGKFTMEDNSEIICKTLEIV